MSTQMTTQTTQPAKQTAAQATSQTTTQTMTAPSLSQWWANSTPVEVTVNDTEHSGGKIKRHISVHVDGNGPWLTLLHGFPSSSWDWSRVIPHLTSQFRVLTFDLLGYGNSDKPHDHRYSTPEHADILEALWQHFGIKEASIVGHDVGGSITKELLARQLSGTLKVALRNVVFMNSAVYIDHYKPVLITRLMQNPLVGPIIVGRLSEKSMSASIARVFSKAHPATPDDLRQTWQALSHDNGLRNIPRLLHYIPEKDRHFARWNNAVETTKLPLRFIWGMDDPATGRHIADDIRRHKPDAYFIGFEDVGHFPQLEVPDRVAMELKKLT